MFAKYVWCPHSSCPLHSMQGRRTTYVPSSPSFYLMQAPLQNLCKAVVQRMSPPTPPLSYASTPKGTCGAPLFLIVHDLSCKHLYARPSYNVCPLILLLFLSYASTTPKGTCDAPPLSHCTCPLVNAYINICIYCKLCTSIWTKHMDKTKTKEEKRINIKCICEKLNEIRKK